MEAKRRKPDPQQGGQANLFRGFEHPKANYSKLPHALIDALPLFSTKAELAVVLYVLRHTYGYGDHSKRISLEEFENGRLRRDGSRIDGGVGMHREAIIKGIRRAVADGFLRVRTEVTSAGRVRKAYALRFEEPEDE